MVYCVVVGCKNRSDLNGSSVRFYSFPKDENLRDQWVSACGNRKAYKIDCARVCSEHFAQGDFKLQDMLLNVPENKRRIKSGVVPSKNLPNPKRLSKQEKKRKRLENKALVEESIASYERKQRMQNTCGENYGIQENGEVCKGLASYVSTFLSNEMQTPSEERLTEGGMNMQQCTDSLESYDTERSLDDHSYSHIKYFTNGTTQTEYDYGCCKELHIMQLEAQNRKLKAALKKQAIRAQENEKLRSSLSAIMTKGQIKRLLHPGKQLKWNAEDIASSMSLYSAGPNAYALLRKRNFPLPSSSTLRCRAGKIELKPGILNSILQLMNKMDYDEKFRFCVLCFNKIKLKTSSYIGKSNDMTLTRAKWAHLVMVRGLIRDWSQIIYYDLDVPMSASILKSIITKLEGIRYVVTAVVSDMAPTTTSLWEELGVSTNQPFFRHPLDKLRKVFFFVDVRHLIKLLRNGFIGTGFILNGKIIDTSPIKEILGLDKCELKVSHDHLVVPKHALRKLKLATALLSDSVSAEIKRHISFGEIQSPAALECADFIKVVSDWFELFNIQYTGTCKTGLNAYGLTLRMQNSILASMNEKMRNLKTPKRTTVLRFHSGVLLNNTALMQMLDYITVHYNIKYIITASLNHEELERFCNNIRFKGGPDDHPTPLEFKYRLRSALLGKMIL